MPDADAFAFHVILFRYHDPLLGPRDSAVAEEKMVGFGSPLPPANEALLVHKRFLIQRQSSVSLLLGEGGPPRETMWIRISF